MLRSNYGKVDIEKTSKTISENAKETSYNYLLRSLESKKSSISESINTYIQHDYLVDTNFFSKELNTFECLSFLSDGNKILNPSKLRMLPYFNRFIGISLKPKFLYEKDYYSNEKIFNYFFNIYLYINYSLILFLCRAQTNIKA